MNLRFTLACKILCVFYFLSVTTALSASYDDKECTSLYCTEWEWYNKKGRFNPLSIKWPLHHTGEIYKDFIDGGNFKLEVLYKDHKSQKQRSSLLAFRKSPECPDPHFLKEGIPMEAVFECIEESKTKPHWEHSNCSLIASTFTDQVVFVDGPGCSKTLRHWVIIDWCKYKPNTGAHNTNDKYVLVKDIPGHTAYFSFDSGPYGYREDGYYTFTQVLKVQEHDPPKLWSCADLEIDLTGKCEGKVIIKNTAEDTGLCPGEKVEITAEIFDQWNNLKQKKWFYTPNSVEFHFETPVLQTGDYEIHWTITDGCKNKSHCRQKLKIRDKTPPQLTCIQNISSSMSDPHGVTIWASDFVRKIDGPCLKGDITVSFAPDKVETGKHFNCETGLGIQGMTLYAWDKFGNQTTCYVQFFVSDNFGCNNGGFTVGGAVTDRFGRTISNATVSVVQNNQVIGASESNNRGLFNIAGVPRHVSNAVIDLNIPDTKANGIDEKDLIKLLRHIHGVEKLKNVLEYAAADVNEDGKIDIQDYFDLVTMLYDFKGREVNFRPFKFADETRFRAGFTSAAQMLTPISVRHFKHRYNIIALKTGDIDYSWTQEPVSTARSVIKSSFTSNQDNALISYRLEVPRGVGVYGLSLPVSSPHHIDDIKINGVSQEWFYSSIKRTVELLIPEAENGVIEITSHKSIDLSVIQGVVNGEENEPKLVNIHFSEQKTILEGSLIASPNPFNDRINIELWCAKSQQGSYEILDMSGRTVQRGVIQLNENYNRFSIENTDRIMNGVYLLKVNLETSSLVQKIIKQ